MRRTINEQLNIGIAPSPLFPTRYTRGLNTSQPQLATEDWTLDFHNDVAHISNPYSADGSTVKPKFRKKFKYYDKYLNFSNAVGINTKIPEVVANNYLNRINSALNINELNAARLNGINECMKNFMAGQPLSPAKNSQCLSLINNAFDLKKKEIESKQIATNTAQSSSPTTNTPDSSRNSPATSSSSSATNISNSSRNSSSPEKSGLGTGVIVGISIGAVLIIGVGAYFIFKK